MNQPKFTQQTMCQPKQPMGPCGTQHEPLYKEHHSRSTIPSGLEATEEHLKYKGVGYQETPSMDCGTVNLFLVRRDISDGMVEWIIVANEDICITKHDKQETTLT